jgi:hypothetical protein
MLKIDSIRLDELTTDPTSPVDGDIWINTTDKVVRVRVGGQTSVVSKSFVPWVWSESAMPKNQSATQMSVLGFPSGIGRFAPVRDTSIVSISVQLSTPVTTGWIDFEITKGGTATGQKVRMNNTTGAAGRLMIPVGTVTGSIADRIAVEWSSSASMAPNNTVNSVVMLEVQDT